ncbi:hypothetical protein HYT33_01885 [Candidatus Roizmanbacteria bacterium]|nr:hypothetical protein [Candidatus Roizmanbacteria bacterium]
MKELLNVGYAAIDQIKGREYYGGAAAGIAINGKNLGLQTGLLALFGSDERSKIYWKYLTRLGVDLSLSYISDHVNLPVNIVLSDEKEHRWNDFGIFRFFKDIQVESSLINQYKVIHLASAHYTLVDKVLSRRDQKKGILTYSPGPKLLIDKSYLQREALAASEIVFFNQREWEKIQGLLGINHPKDLFRFGPRVVIVTCGEDGALIFSEKRGDLLERYVPAFRIANPEPTGAGDAFALGFIIGYINSLSLDTCGEIGSVLAAASVKNDGIVATTSGIRRFKEVLYLNSVTRNTLIV